MLLQQATLTHSTRHAHAKRGRARSSLVRTREPNRQGAARRQHAVARSYRTQQEHARNSNKAARALTKDLSDTARYTRVAARIALVRMRQAKRADRAIWGRWASKMVVKALTLLKIPVQCNSLRSAMPLLLSQAYEQSRKNRARIPSVLGRCERCAKGARRKICLNTN